MFHFIKAKISGSKQWKRLTQARLAIYVKYRKGYRAFDYAVDYRAYVRQFGNAA